MKVAVIGTGNVATQFARIFGVNPISSRSLAGLPEDADLYIISVSDSAVGEVAAKLPAVKGIVVHTTGSVPMEVLSQVDCNGYGVIYPFQTISRQRQLSPDKIPLLLEASDFKTLEEITNIAQSAGFSNTALADSEKRRKVHLTGTFACNFTNAMMAISQQILSDCGIDKGIIRPLVEETIEKLKTILAKDAQTGPAVRNDISTLNAHLGLLKELGMDEEAEIYNAVSNYIMSSHNLITP